MNSGSPWTAEEAEQLRRLVAAQELDYAGIAVAMGRSKDAIIGKAHRLHLPPPALSERTRARGARWAHLLSEKQRLAFGLTATQPAATTVAPAPAPVAFVPFQIATPPVRTCQFPRGHKPNWDWCNAPVFGCGPYCAAHRAVCYQRLPTRSALREAVA